MPFQIIRNDITRVRADAIVNTANPEVRIGLGVDAAIYHSAGSEELLKARREIGILNPGEVGVTPAFKLNAEYIIHVSGPVWEGGENGEEKILRSCYDRALTEAVNKNCKSIAFPLIATGTYGFPKELGMGIAVDAFTEFLKHNEIEILLVVFTGDTAHISGKWVKEIKSFIDDEYVLRAKEREYGSSNYSVQRRCVVDELEAEYENKAVSKRPQDKLPPIRIPQFLRPEVPAPKGASAVAGDLESILKQTYSHSFEKHLQGLINKKGLKNSEVYATANISKQYFSKLLKGKVKPSKEKILALAIGLHLNLDETIDFLRIAGYALSPISQTDKVVEYFIKHEDYNVIKIDIVLFDFGLEPLSS